MRVLYIMLPPSFLIDSRLDLWSENFSFIKKAR